MGLFDPWRYVADVTAVDLDELRRAGKRAILLDRDNTVVPRDTRVVPERTAAWLRRAGEMGFRLCFVSNNHRAAVQPDAEAFGALCVADAAKPLPVALWRALRLTGAARREAVLFGDQVFTDVVAGNLARIDTVLVVPQTTVDLAHTLVLRRFEARVLGGRAPEGGGSPAGGPADGDRGL